MSQQPAEQKTSFTRPELQVLTEQRMTLAPTAIGLRHIEQTNAGVLVMDEPRRWDNPEQRESREAIR